MPPRTFKTKTSRNRGAEALKRLRGRWEQENEGETWEAEREPIITPMLKAVPGGIPAVITALSAHDDDDARAFTETYNAIGATDRKVLPIEAIAFAAGIGSLRLAEIAQTALFLYCSLQTKMLISASMVKVTKSIIKAATDEVPIMGDVIVGDSIHRMQVGKTNGDVKAMELFGRISGIAPVPKGAQIAIQNNFGGDKDDEPRQGQGAPAAWRSAEERLREFQDMTEPKRLPSPESKPFIIGGHVDKLQAETAEIIRSE